MSANFIDLSATSQKYTEPVPFQQFKGNYATMVHTATTGMFGTVTLPVGTTPGVCRQLCESNINCEMWSFDSSRRCNLYNSTDASTITGIRINKTLRTTPVTPFSIHSNTIPSRNLVTTASAAPSLQACEERCNVTSACALYTYSLTGSCSMYQFGLANSGNVGSSKDLLIATPQVNFQSIVLQNTSQNAGTSAKTFRVTYSNVFTGSLPYSIYDANNPSQIMFSSGTNPTSPATSTFTGIPTLGNVYVVSLGGTRFISPQRTPFYANAATSPTNFTFDYGGYRCHVFHANGTLIINGTGTIEYYVVGGGGGGAGGTAGKGGGGGGGGQVMTGFSNLPPGSVNQLTITVGSSGTLGAAGAQGGNGGNSVISGTSFTTVTATGGKAGTTTSGGASGSGNTGSSSGGGGGTSTPSTTVNGGAGISSNFRNGSTLLKYGGGGGGGGSGTSSGGYGTGTDGGGNGATNIVSGSSTPAMAGTANTGGGGGGGRGSNSATNVPATAGAAGGSGIVMIRYLVRT